MESTVITQFQEGVVRGFVHRPSQPCGAGIVLTHSAGSNCQAPLPVAIANTFSSAGFLVLRCDLPFRQRRPFGPPSPSTAAQDRAGLKEAVSAIRHFSCGRVFLGGHSYGGRQASMLAAEEPGLVDALLLLSFPLHPPAKPDQRRTAHFPALQTRALFVHGSRDPFGSLEEMTAATQSIPALTKIVAIERAGHDLARGKFDIDRLVIKEFSGLAGV